MILEYTVNSNRNRLSQRCRYSCFLSTEQGRRLILGVLSCKIRKSRLVTERWYLIIVHLVLTFSLTGRDIIEVCKLV